MKEGPAFQNKLTHCHTKDNVEISVTYTCHTGIVNNKAYKKHTQPGKGRQALNVGWRDKLQQQIEDAIAYVLQHYRWDSLHPNNSHEQHIERQIRNCLNENYQDESIPLAAKGLTVQSIGPIKIAERSKLY